MVRPLRVLLGEDNEDDAALLLNELRRGGYEPVFQRVDSPAVMHSALQQDIWDVVLTEWNLPHFNALFALEMLKSQGVDLPFIIVSGTIGEEAAALALKAGAHDLVCKQNLNRLNLIVERELREAEERRARRKAEAALAASEERLQLVSRATNDAVRNWDLSTNGIWWNEGFFTLFGYRGDEVESGVESWYDRLHLEDRRPCHRQLLRGDQRRRHQLVGGLSVPPCRRDLRRRGRPRLHRAESSGPGPSPDWCNDRPQRTPQGACGAAGQ
jgi:PAS domain-containing protein